MKKKNKFINLVQFGHPNFIITARYLSGILKDQGYSTRLISIQPQKQLGSGKSWDYGEYNLTEQNIEDLIDLCQDALFVGFTVFTFDVHMLKTFYSKFKEYKIPVVVGGPHPTLDPYHASFFSDYVCIGDGENGVSELANELSKSNENDTKFGLINCQNIYPSSLLSKNQAKADSLYGVETLIKTSYRSDYSFDCEYLIDGSIIKITKENADQHLDNYSTFFSRGCAHNCSFCAHQALAKKSGFSKRIKSKNLNEFIEEIKQIKDHHWVKRVTFFDPNVLANRKEQLKTLLQEYKKNVDLPLTVTGFTFNAANEDILKAFAEAGTNYFIFGIQSASEPVRKLLNRKESNVKIKEIDDILVKLKKEFFLKVQYDIILDIPWSNVKDSLKTIVFLSKLRAYDYLDLFSLRFFPGTLLFQKAIDDKLIDRSLLEEEYKKVYRGLKYSYENFLFLLLRDSFIPRILTKLAVSNFAVNLGNHIFRRYGQMIFNNYSRIERIPRAFKKLRRMSTMLVKGKFSLAFKR